MLVFRSFGETESGVITSYLWRALQRRAFFTWAERETDCASRRDIGFFFFIPRATAGSVNFVDISMASR